MLIITFLILSISRPVIRVGNSAILEDPSSLSLVIVVDDTFSNINDYSERSQEDIVRDKIQLIIKNYNEMNYLEVLSINKDLLFKGLVKNFDPSSINLAGNYSYGSISPALSKYFSDEFIKDYLSGHMYIISDMQEATLRHEFGSDWWDVVFVDSSYSTSDPLIENITIEDKVIFPMKPFSITMEILNKGDVSLENVKAYLYIDGMQLVQNFNVLSKDSKKIEFKAVVDSRGSFDVLGEIRWGNKDVGNKYFSKVNVFPRMDVCFCQLENFKNAKYLKASISAIADNDIFSISECSASLGELSLYDIVVIDDYRLLDEQEMTLYLNNGGHILFFPGSYSNDYISFDSIKVKAYLSSDELTLFKDDIIGSDMLENVFKYMNNDAVFSIKNKYLLPLGNESLISASGKGSLWNRIYQEKGLLDIFGFDLDIKNNDFALKGFFIPFMYSLLTSHSKVYPAEFFLGQENFNYYKDIYRKKRSLNLVGDKDYSEVFNSIEELHFRNIDLPGFYFLSSENDTIEELFFNISPYEFSKEVIDFQILEQNYDSATLVSSDEQLTEYISRRLNPAEVWHFFLAIAIMLLIIESIIINAFSRKK